MTVEMISLLGFLAMFAALLLMQPLVLAKAKGMQYVTGNRDGGTAQDHPVVGRLARTVNNSMEAAVLFVPLVLATEVLETSNALTQYGAVAFVAARIAYAVLYPLGIVGLRTVVWNLGLVSLATMAAGLISI